MTDDDELRTRLRQADPAASLPPIAPDRVSRLLEETMTATTSPAPLAARWRLVTLAAALIVAIAAGAGWLLTRPEKPSTPVAVAPATSAAGAVTDLTLAGAQAKCREPEPAVLAASADFAFAGTVTDISGNTVSLRVSKVYRGSPASRVRVAQTGDTSEELIGANGKFETGKDYLVASSRGGVLICGYSGEADLPGLRELYDKAF